MAHSSSHSASRKRPPAESPWFTLPLACEAGPAAVAAALALDARATAGAVEAHRVIVGRLGEEHVGGRDRRATDGGRRVGVRVGGREAAPTAATWARGGHRAVWAAVAVAACADAARTTLAPARAVVQARRLVTEGPGPADEAVAGLGSALAPPIRPAWLRTQVGRAEVGAGAGAAEYALRCLCGQ